MKRTEMFANMQESEILEQVQRNPHIVRYIKKELKERKSFLLELIRKNNLCFYYFKEKWKDDEEIVVEAVKQDKDNLNFCSQRLREKLIPLNIKKYLTI